MSSKSWPHLIMPFALVYLLIQGTLGSTGSLSTLHYLSKPPPFLSKGNTTPNTRIMLILSSALLLINYWPPSPVEPTCRRSLGSVRCHSPAQSLTLQSLAINISCSALLPTCNLFTFNISTTIVPG